MKRKLCCILSFLCLFVTPIAFGGCNDNSSVIPEESSSIDNSSVEPDETSNDIALSLSYAVLKKTNDCLVIHVDICRDEYKLIDVMKDLQESDKITYTMNGTFLSSLNGVTPTGKQFWALYTSDTELSNTAWGSYTYEGKTYGSSILGVTELPIAENGYYIWALSSY